MDDERRELERKAAAGDGQAKLRLAHNRCRAGECCAGHGEKRLPALLVATEFGMAKVDSTVAARMMLRLEGDETVVVETLLALARLGVSFPSDVLLDQQARTVDRAALREDRAATRERVRRAARELLDGMDELTREP